MNGEYASYERKGTRHDEVLEEENANMIEPRIGRRESEPHSAEVTYLFDVMFSNFPGDRPTWDLHHFFMMEEEGKKVERNIRFDISFFKDFDMPTDLPCYKAEDHDDRVPEMAVNILSKSTWRTDISEHVDTCRLLGIKLYVVFAPYHVATWQYKPPFLRAYILEGPGKYVTSDLTKIACKEGEPLETLVPGDNVIDVSGIVPFKIALMEKKRLYKNDDKEYRMVLIHPEKPELFLSRAQLEAKRAEEERKRAEEERKRAEDAEKRVKMLEAILKEHGIDAD